jgi:hypothetical protein
MVVKIAAVNRCGSSTGGPGIEIGPVVAHRGRAADIEKV